MAPFLAQAQAPGRARPGMRMRAAAGLAIALFLLDQLAKAKLTTEAWAYHPSQGWGLGEYYILALAALLVWLFPAASLAAALVTAGTMGNATSATFGPVENPFQVGVAGGVMAFNLADVYIALGVAVGLLILGASLLRSWRARRV